ncbi:MAG TPA: hypothetical protein VLQ91_00415 [Draconibacterium sp.]|nr:hypothetical protein [Draconibacterium sp.]
MALNKGKHIVEEIAGVRCTVVETGITQERIDFLKKLLELNGYEVKTGLDKDGVSLKIGVTDILFNPVVDVYKRHLKSPSGKKVTPAYWLQKSDNETEAEVNYWTFGR